VSQGDESAGVWGPTYGAVEPSACGPRRGVAKIPAAGCTAVAERKAEEGKDELTRGDSGSEREKRERARLGRGERAPADGPGVADREEGGKRASAGPAEGGSGPGRGPRG
jgi:hypothetical protein